MELPSLGGYVLLLIPNKIRKIIIIITWSGGATYVIIREVR